MHESDCCLLPKIGTVIGGETAGTLVAAIGFRNVLAHEYGHVNHDEVYESLQTGLSVYDTFIQQVAQWMRKTS
ncbi:HepT-like ribonuclease domain-containing protein [Halorubrum halophilum]|uniref:HepT-like ribonuclease domain-containing protein n=1 Tax=Halorubrum halophilum TaxID=413816 RepID=UPI0009E63E1D|nr:DUF86 domain-containing protein [Halorubrum halophilum]